MTGLCLGLVGDVFLLRSGSRLVAAGLGAFLLGHVAYLIGFLTLPAGALAWLGATLAGVGAWSLLPPILRGLGSSGQEVLRGPVVAYVLIVSIMLVAAFGTEVTPVAIGALLFYCSDAVLAWDRWVRPMPGGAVANLVPYHLGQLLLALSVAVT